MELKPAYHFSFDELAALFNLAFTNYVGGNVQFNGESLARWVAHENVDLALSQIVMRDGQPIGFGHIGRQGWSNHLAAFGIIPDATGQGVGKAMMIQLINEAKQRGDRVFELEAIEQNPRAVRLYEGVGFQKVRRLVGYEAKPPVQQTASPDAQPQTLDVYQVAKVAAFYAADGLPWDVGGMMLARNAPPDVGYRLNQAYAVISSGQAVVLRALIVPPEYRHQGQAARLLQALIAATPEKTWIVPAVWPEEIAGGLLTSLGFTKMAISQWQMRLGL